MGPQPPLKGDSGAVHGGSFLAHGNSDGAPATCHAAHLPTETTDPSEGPGAFTGRSVCVALKSRRGPGLPGPVTGNCKVCFLESGCACGGPSMRKPAVKLASRGIFWLVGRRGWTPGRLEMLAQAHREPGVLQLAPQGAGRNPAQPQCSHSTTSAAPDPSRARGGASRRRAPSPRPRTLPEQA